MEELTNFALRFYRILAKKAAKDEMRGVVFLFFTTKILPASFANLKYLRHI